MVKLSTIYVPGDRHVECAVCGYAYPFSQMRRQRGHITCPECYDAYQPLDYPVKIRKARALQEVE